ncbi:MAG: DUF4157 domain-containing protein [Solirubrobacteraceae bacterium]|jgi:hypothetical protein
MARSRHDASEQTAIARAWRRLEPLALYPRPVDLTRVRIIAAPRLFALPWFRRFDGYTVWSTILLRRAADRDDEELIAHELVHVWQGQHEWVRLWMSYVRPSTFWGDHSGYWENRYEVQARSAVARTAPPVPSHAGTTTPPAR